MNIVDSEKKDRNDDVSFRHPRDRRSGVDIHNEFGQSVPFFFNRDGSSLDLIGQYRGASAFLICNGPSFNILNKDLLRKPGVVTFGINNGPKTFRPNFWTCVDDPARFIKSIWLDPKITKFVPQAAFEKPIFDNEKWVMTDRRVGSCPNVIGYKRNEHFRPEKFLEENTINWGNHKDHGGGRSVMLPSLRILHLLGFRKVYLLGCDLNMTAEQTYHFDEQRDKGAVNGNMGTYKRLIEEYFPQLKPVFDSFGFHVYNCNKNSSLKAFPFVDFEEAILEATKDLGDIENERTWGMYTKPEEREKWKVEPPQEVKKTIASQVSSTLQRKHQEQKDKIKNNDSPNRPQINQVPTREHLARNPTFKIIENNSVIAQPENKEIISAENKEIIVVPKLDTPERDFVSKPMPVNVKPRNESLFCMSTVASDGTIITANQK